MANDAFHIEAESLKNLKPLHPRTIKSSLERVLEDERVRAEEPQLLLALSQTLFTELELPQALSEIWLEKTLNCSTPEALDQQLAQLIRQPHHVEWLALSNKTNR
jgi:hypothetical protein